MALFSWLNRPSGKAQKLLAAYADDLFVHAGAPGVLSPGQRETNILAFIASIQRRITRLQSFAAALDTALPIPDGDLGKIELIAQQLDVFCKTKLAGFDEFTPAVALDGRAQEPQGIARHVQTLVIDMGAYCGEAGIRCAPKYGWVNDTTRYTKATMMRTAGRIVIGHNPAKMPSLMNNHIDVMDNVGFALTQIIGLRTAKRQWRPNYFGFLASIAKGQHV